MNRLCVVRPDVARCKKRPDEQAVCCTARRSPLQGEAR